ncbi:hypothetical protein [Caballeronia grimmiae]|uniref:Uncharacterized protein n=1 Tax=Caballeronia grimmiae TaxID=1071679 RepID=A0A069PAH8_9BURK|nr:hypothetical protein [Caballeronia grimmiae]KDR34301.1 hypothetical protein BG57_06300 [Caballeronia grimmiae]GGD50487.1 hypothetical protein GCM10010985_00260 [Caballeronia grimmiae]
MPKASIYQIFYSSETQNALDPGFIPLDNTHGRSDWYEYWPIRRFLLDTPLNENEFYGFLSPQFGPKSGLDSTRVHAFVQGVPDSTDVIVLSPFFDVGALALNVFVQGTFDNAESWTVFVDAVKHLMPEVQLGELVMDSTNTIFCNYFLAKPAFWRCWLEMAEKLFVEAEQKETPLGKSLNQSHRYRGGYVDEKIFVMERLASLILSTQPQWRVESINPISLPSLRRGAGDDYKCAVIILDALKVAARKTGRKEYMETYRTFLAQLVRRESGAA